MYIHYYDQQSTLYLGVYDFYISHVFGGFSFKSLRRLKNYFLLMNIVKDYT